MLSHRRLGLLALASVVLALLAGAGSASTGLARGAAGARTFTNPVYAHNFPDPYILKVGSAYYAYGTGTCDMNLQVMHSTDLVHWIGHKELLPSVPRWSSDNCVDFFQNRMVWAPEVFHRADGKYILYYVAHWVAQNKQCVSYAVSASPDGPFRDSSRKPLVCQTQLGGSIDPDYLHDSNGQLYLFWKNDGNCCGLTTYIFSQRMDPSGTKLLGKPARLESNDKPWEGNLVEAPTMWKHGGKYYLFYSANAFNTSHYAVGYALCKGPSGPCTDGKSNPILRSRCRAAGPGHQALFVDAKGQTWIAYHAWKPADIGDRPGGPGRQLWFDRVNWKGGTPVVHGPTCTPQAAPAAN